MACVDPIGFTLAVSGSAAKPGGGSWSNYSDARLKHDIAPLEGSLDRLLALRGVSFVYNDPAAIHELPGARIGMVAQEVEKVFPDWVEVGADGYRRLTFRGFEALAVSRLDDPTPTPQRDLVRILVAHGLYPKEAEAMVATWSDS